jgi:hypothetical protein
MDFDYSRFFTFGEAFVRGALRVDHEPASCDGSDIFCEGESLALKLAEIWKRP